MTLLDLMSSDLENQRSFEPSEHRSLLRQYLARFLKLMAWAALLGFAYWCLAGLGSDEQTFVRRYQVDVSGLKAGEFRAFSVGNQPLVVLYRSDEQLLSLNDTRLNDPHSWQSADHSNLHARHRGVMEDWLVVEVLGTELNCPVEVLGPGGEFQGRPWPGGFADKCRGQRYDWAGRVYADQGAKRNLRAFRYRLIDGGKLEIDLR